MDKNINLFKNTATKTADEFMVRYANKQIRKATRIGNFGTVSEWKRIKSHAKERLEK